MTSTTADQNVLKTDTRGRVRVTRERREALLEEFAGSGLSAAQFARLAGINYATFAGWVAKRRRTRKQSGSEAEGRATAEAGVPGGVRLLEAVIESRTLSPVGSCLGGGLRLELPGGAQVQVESPSQLRLAAELLGLLAQSLRRPC